MGGSWLARLALLLKDILRAITGIGRGQWFSRFGMYIGAMLATTGGALVANVLRFLGLTMAINTFVAPQVMTYIVGPLTGLPADWQNALAMMRVDHAITIVISASAIATARSIRLRPRSPSLWD